MTPISSIVFICQGLIVHDRLYTPRLADDARGRYNPPQSIEKTCIETPSKMAVEQAPSIVKPDATGRNVTGIINAAIEKAGLRIVAQKQVWRALEAAQRFYAEQRRPFYDDLCAFMTSAPVVMHVREGDDAIAKYRKVMGATYPAEAKKGTIRRRFARTMAHNSVHGSDSAVPATRGITLNFLTDEIVG